MANALNQKQVDLLRHLNRQTGPVSVSNLDGRIVRALKLRDCIEERDGWVSVTEGGRVALEGGPPRRRRRRANAASHPRAEAIYRAVAALELALPKEAEVAVGNIFAYADDVVDGLRKYARRLEARNKNGGAPR
ncbi:MAG TPA: hypothetical protein VFQ45_16710 [Longimicrobium sp.]|nr:hypothetical protein [Longimicrobium sp.]